MADAPNFRDLFLAGRRQMLLSPTKFDPAIIDTEGSDVNILLSSSAAMGEEVVNYLVGRLNAKSLGTAKDEDLDREIYDRHQLPRLGAQNSVVTLTLTRSGNIGFTVERGSVFGSDTGETFEIQNDVAFAAGNPGPLEVIAVAQRAGRSGNVVAGAITRVISTQTDNTLVVNNTEPAAGGRDEETDESYLARARGVFIAARRGTQEAIEFGALETGRVSQAAAVELFDPGTAIPGYRVQLNISDSDGQSNAALASEVRLTLGEYRCWGVPVSVISAVPQYINITLVGLQFTAGVNTTDVLERAADAIVAAVNALPPGATLRRTTIFGALEQIDGLIVPNNALTVPAGDVVPSTGTVIRTTRDRVALSG